MDDNIIEFPEQDIKDPPVYALNQGQQAAFDVLVPFCMRKTPEKKYLLEGYAGTGKSFLLTRVVEEVRKLNPGVNFGMTAPTHKAVRVLKKHSALRDTLDFGTIHSFLGLKQKINEFTGEVSYEPDFDARNGRRIDDIHILIIDEASMLDDKLFDHIENEMRSNPFLRVIYTGDRLQIPPVGKKQKTGEAYSIPFLPARQQSHQIHVLSLVEPQRQAADSPIIMYAHKIREQFKRQGIEFDVKSEYADALVKIGIKGNQKLFEELFTKFFKSEEFQQDPDYCKVIAWKNSVVRMFNKMIREIIYERKDLPMLLEGEKLVMEEAVIGAKGTIVLAKNEDVVLTELDVMDIVLQYKVINRDVFKGGTKEDPLSELTKHIKTATLKVYKITLRDDDGRTYRGNVVHEDSLELYNSILEEVKTAALKSSDNFDRREMWREFYRIPDKFFHVNHNYAITGHKSQGSSYDYCFSMEWDMNTNWDIEERNRIKYVAATRARTKLFIVN